MASATTTRRLVGVAGAAEHSGLSKTTIRRLIKSGVLPAYWLGANIRIDLDELDATLVPVKGGSNVSAA